MSSMLQIPPNIKCLLPLSIIRCIKAGIFMHLSTPRTRLFTLYSRPVHMRRVKPLYTLKPLSILPDMLHRRIRQDSLANFCNKSLTKCENPKHAPTQQIHRHPTLPRIVNQPITPCPYLECLAKHRKRERRAKITPTRLHSSECIRRIR